MSINRKDLVDIMNGKRRPAGRTTPTRSTTDESTIAPRTLGHAQATYDKASQDLYTILYLLTEKPAQLLVLKHEDETGIGGNGQKAWQELESEFLKVTDEVIRDELAELAPTSMKPGPYPDDYFMEAILKRNEVTGIGEPMTDRRFEDSLVQGFTNECDAVKFQICLD